MKICKRFLYCFLSFCIVFASFFFLGDPFLTVYADKETGAYTCLLDAKMDGWIGITHDLTNLDDNAIISGNELAPAEIKFYGKGKFYFSQPLSHREGNEVAFPEFTISGNFYNAEGNRAYENSLMYYNESYSPKILEFGRFTEGSGENKVTYNHSYEITSANVYWAREVSDFGFDIKNPFEMFRWEMKTGYLYVVFHGKYTRTNSTDTKRYPNLVGKSMVIHMCYNVQDIEDSTLGLGAFFHPGKLIHQEVDTNAEEMPETVSYSSFSADIVEGTKTAAAAVAVAVAAGAAASAMQNGEEEKKRRKYEMAIYKNFGDTLYPDKEEQVFATILVEDENGSEYSGQLAQNIRIVEGSDAVTVVQTGMSDESWNSATVKLSGAVGEPIVTFIYEDIGGSFTNHVHFKANDPRIRFWGWLEQENRFDTDSDYSEIDMVAGGGGQVTVPFVFIMTSEEPKTIDFLPPDEFRVTYVHDEKTAFAYRATVENLSQIMEKEAGIFANPKEIKIPIRAEFPSGMVVDSYISVILYPDGLSVFAETVADGRLTIDTCEDPNASPGHAKIKPTSFYVIYAYTGDDGKAVIEENHGLSFGDIDDNHAYGNTFTENFRYRLSNMDVSGIYIYPQDTLPMIGKPYQAKMEIAYDGERYSEKAELPLAFTGEQPAPPSSAEWQRAYDRLRKAVEIFGIGEDPQIRALIRAHKAKDHSAAELEDIRNYIILSGKHFYEKQSREYQEIDETMTRYIVVTSALVKAGDHAIEYLLKYYFPVYGGTAAAFLNPLKNMLAEFIGQYIGPGSEWDGNYNDLQFFKNLVGAIQAGLGEALTGGDIKIEKMGQIVSAYLMYSFANHYFFGKGVTDSENAGNEKGDIYKSVLAAFGDLGLQYFKSWFKKQLETLSEAAVNASKSWIERIGKWFAGRLNNLVNNAANSMIHNAGMKAFTQSVRQAYAVSGTSLTQAGYEAAHAARLQAENVIRQNIKQFLDASAECITFTASETIDAGMIALGPVLNYLLKGKKSDNTALGHDVEEVLTEFLVDRFGLTVERVYHTVANPLDFSVRIENGVLIIKIMGYGVELPLLQNAITLTDIFFEFCFSWMEEIFEDTKPDPDSLPDERDNLSGDTEIVDRMQIRLQEIQPIQFTTD